MSDNQTEPITRTTSPELDAILGVKFPVLNNGFIRVVDYMGNDAAICQAARCSYGAGTKSINEDRGLLRYLMRHRHTSPFEQASIKLHVRMPIMVMRQWVRHRTAKLNELSGRYSIMPDDRLQTAPTEWRTQSEVNKQGSGGFIDAETGAQLSLEEAEFQKTAQAVYERRLAAGVAKEQARNDLPLSTYTEIYWVMDLHNLLHFLSLRMDSHAQKEIRDYATIIGEQIVAKWVPLVWEAFQDYRLNSITLSGPEMKTLRDSISARGGFGIPAETQQKYGLAKTVDGVIKPTREGDELRAKLQKMFAQEEGEREMES